MVSELIVAMRAADDEPSTNAIVLAGAGRSFCQGTDGDVGALEDDRRVLRQPWHLVQCFLQIENPIVTKVVGRAAGVGLVIALLSDAVVAAEDAELGDPNVEVGLVPGHGLAAILPLVVGPFRAKELLMLSRFVSGREAADMGMINRAVPPNVVDATVADLAAELAAQPTYALRATKAVVNRYIQSMTSAVLDLSLAYEEVGRGVATGWPTTAAAREPAQVRGDDAPGR
jgi:enoyl-CoA hydratase